MSGKPLKTPLWMGAAGMLSAMGIRAWMSTLDYRVLFYDRTVDGIYPSERPRIYVFWHEYILIPLALRGNCNLTMLLSKHRDADILYRVAHHMGFECVRGSTYGGATEALLELSRRGRYMHLAITPDGPRGPRRKMAPGPVYLASKLQMPLVLLGMGVDRPWRAPTWDRFAVPRPGSRARALVSAEIAIPPNLNREQLELRRQGVEQLLNDLTAEAESWAASGSRRPGAVPVRAQGLLLAGQDCSAHEPAACAPPLLAAASLEAESHTPRRVA
ncbi:MAG: lysophospholipid acyltransferase family protein [Pirellulales bacterium]|nr:lysophospholipid acyltransferase family protein [Pirellulales bacterium]